ncbi:MAG: tRNA pseudouridine(38-40) synthase TruA [Alphaproteobacteria bacterium]|nr:tRNA pseudouridine(38-40) synthase TruA [Alphaproteobacteria bacterium]
MRYKITIEYDGTNILGWQRQLDGPSVQEYLENAVLSLVPHSSSSRIEVQGAGRTDAGVHALAQVAHFDLEREIEDWKLRDAINFHLRDQNAPVVVTLVEAVSSDFNARFSAKGRGYIYRILNRRAPSALEKNRVWWVPVELNITKMQEAAKHLLGYHDFSSFRAAACQAKSPLKTLDKIEIYQQGEEIIFEVEAKSFLHHQVRNIVGTLKLVGDGHLQPSDIKKILEAKDRKVAGPTAPASGLYLSKVWY